MKNWITTHASFRFANVVLLSLGFFAWAATFFCERMRSTSRWLPPVKTLCKEMLRLEKSSKQLEGAKKLTSHRESCLSTDVLSRFETEFCWEGQLSTLLNPSGDCIGVSENGICRPTTHLGGETMNLLRYELALS